ncbi:MAG: hypothetical protein QOF42_295, partial [Gammaproteobacteria bacterium]|nr:hypothetical protein [Gammaproteobacteria bacterium]
MLRSCKRMVRIIGWAGSALVSIGALQTACAADTAPGKLVHRFREVQISPNTEYVASVEGDSSASGGQPTVRDLVIRNVKSGAATTVSLPCGRVTQCWPGSPSWSPDSKHLSFTLRTPGSHSRSIYSVAPDGGALTKLLEFNGTIEDLRYMPDGRIAMLAIKDAKKEVGATEAGAPV